MFGLQRNQIKIKSKWGYASFGGCHTAKETWCILTISGRIVFGALNSVETISLNTETCTAIEPQQKQLQNGEQVSFSCGLAGWSVISDFWVLPSSLLCTSVQGIEQRNKI